MSVGQLIFCRYGKKKKRVFDLLRILLLRVIYVLEVHAQYIICCVAVMIGVEPDVITLLPQE